MRRFLLLPLALFTGGCAPAEAPETALRPNIIYILADDLGYGDLSVQGQQHFETPNIDRLASEGIRFTQHYSGSTVCAPSRDALLTGRHTGHTFIRGNKPVEPEGQYPIPAEAVTVAELLADAGYRTGAAGKWGLGAPDTEGVPTRQGFDFFYGYNCQREAHSYYPDHLWRNEERVPLDGETYAHDLITEEALGFIRRNQDAPFFLFVPYTIPHAGLDVPEDSMAPFVESFVESSFEGRGSYVAQAQPKAAFAGMVTRLDRDVGRILALVDELGLDENTVVMFSSDNGPHLEGGAELTFSTATAPSAATNETCTKAVFGFRSSFVGAARLMRGARASMCLRFGMCCRRSQSLPGLRYETGWTEFRSSPSSRVHPKTSTTICIGSFTNKAANRRCG